MEKQKECFKCHKVKKLSEFYKHPQMPDGTVNKCKECNKVENKNNWYLHREEKREYDVYRQRFSIQRILNHRYACIKRRCEKGKADNTPYFVTGKQYLTKQEWNKWCYEDINYKKFIDLYNIWAQNDFVEKLSPSIDRIDSKKSYIIGNLQWLSKSDNCKKWKN